LLIRDKIRKEITRSDFLVAIITKDAKGSASVNQEIGYALGKDVPVVIMLEKNAKIGVLIHGIDTEEFSRNYFPKSCINIRQHLLTKGISRKKNASSEKNNFTDIYQKYPQDKKLNQLRKDVIAAFAEVGFKHYQNNLKGNFDETEGWEVIKVDIVENSNTKQRFFLDFRKLSSSKINLSRLYDKISDFYFYNVKPSNSWQNMCLIVNLENITKRRIEEVWVAYSTQNTTISVNPSITYYGVGQIHRISKRISIWNFSSSMPRFFVNKVKSKDDLLEKIGLVLNFIDVHKKIFKTVIQLKSLEMKYGPKPERKRKRKPTSYTYLGGKRVPVYRARLPRRRRRR